jgi:hypothetical protein
MPVDGVLGTPQTVDVNGDHAYFVAPLTYMYKQHGKSIKETASFGVALRRTQAGWRIPAGLTPSGHWNSLRVYAASRKGPLLRSRGPSED